MPVGVLLGAAHRHPGAPRARRRRGFYEVIYFLPVTSTLIAMATVWQFLLHPRLGPVNAVLRVARLRARSPSSASPASCIPTLAAIGIWQLLGFNMVLFLAGLSAIPRDLYEAADIDGASHPVDRFLTSPGRCSARRRCSSSSPPSSPPSRFSTRSP